MPDSRKHLQRILNQLWTDFIQTSRFLYTAAFQSECQKIFGTTAGAAVLAVTTEACLQAGILGLARLTIPDKESVTIWYLLDFLRNHPQLFPDISRTKLITLREEMQQTIQAHEELLKKVQHWRDRSLAHRDRKWINNPEHLASSELSPAELKTLLGAVRDILLQACLLLETDSLDSPDHSELLDDLHALWESGSGTPPSDSIA
ncbi:MAG: hypothetical protein JXA25_14505 [Anaerolineales bacterium]|nr:hypothetical protein [Anaerolineales bacterium]